jgi:hypothetical protein
MFGFGKRKPDETWVSAPAEVLEATQGRWAITHGSDAVVSNTELRWKLRLMVRPADEAPFEAEVGVSLPQLMTPRRGTTMMVQYDPADHSHIEVDRSDAAQKEAAIQGVLGHSPTLAGTTVAGMSMDEMMHAAMRDPAAFRQQMAQMAADANGNAAALVQAPPGTTAMFGAGGAFGMAGGVPGAATPGVPGAVPPAPAAAPAAATPGPDDHIAALERLGDLRDRGILTEDEFQAEKRRVLGLG